MTGCWLPVSQAITRIYTATGRLLSVRHVVDLGRRRELDVVSTHEHTRVSESSVAAYEAKHRRPVPRDPDNPAEQSMTPADNDEYERERQQ